MTAAALAGAQYTLEPLVPLVPVVPAATPPGNPAAEAHALREAALREGHAEGYAAGRAEARAELGSALGALSTALQELGALRARTADEVERHAVELGLSVAEKALAGALEADPAKVVDVVRGALRLLVERERVAILVNPDDLELVRAAAAGLSETLGGIEHLDVQEERRVARGGALLRTVVGEVDASLGTKLERARELLVAELSGARA